MKDLLEYIVTNLVSKPENVQIDEQRDNGNVNLTLTVDPSDMGLIIGKGGQTIHSIRKLLTVRAMAENVRVNLQLNEPNEERGTKSEELGKEAEPITSEGADSTETAEETELPQESTEEEQKS